MAKRIILFSMIAAVSIAVVILSGPSRRKQSTLHVLAAISLREAMTEIARDFETVHQAKVELVFGSSGQLASQVEAGAPADVFVSAAENQLDRLAAGHLIDDASRRVIAGNTLVLIVPAAGASGIARFEDLAGPAVRRLAIGEPKSVPAGAYAMKVLKHFSLDATLAGRLVLGVNVRQVLDYVVRGEADAGIVYATDAASAGDTVRIVARAENAWHEPIVYSAATLRSSTRQPLAEEFLKLLTGNAGLQRHGFTPPP